MLITLYFVAFRRHITPPDPYLARQWNVPVTRTYLSLHLGPIIARHINVTMYALMRENGVDQAIAGSYNLRLVRNITNRLRDVVEHVMLFAHDTDVMNRARQKPPDVSEGVAEFDESEDESECESEDDGLSEDESLSESSDELESDDEY